MVQQIYAPLVPGCPEQKIYSEKLGGGSAIFEPNLNYGINLVSIYALNPSAELHSNNTAVLYKGDETIELLGTILITLQGPGGIETSTHLFYITEDLSGPYAGVIGSLSPYDPTTFVHNAVIYAPGL